MAQYSEAIASSCSSDDPYYVVANQSRRTASTQHVKPSDSTLTAFNKGGALLDLARFTDTGSVYGVAYDGAAAAVLERCFPGRTVVPIDCRAVIRQNGSLHCLTMQFPRGVTLS